VADTSRHQVTLLLQRIHAGDRQAASDLLPVVYDELRRLARARMAKERPGQTLQPTALVHEAYLRLIGDEDPGWSNRGHFFAAAAEAMRRILIERARSRARLKRGGNQVRVALPDSLAQEEAPAEDLLALDVALTRLEERDPEMARVVKLRHFVGLSVPETADAMGTSARTVNRLWTAAKAWLHRELHAGPAGERP
jgi:RNA polymerase sigma factor (TIGR02999 family)